MFCNGVSKEACSAPSARLQHDWLAASAKKRRRKAMHINVAIHP
ncbi:hypothetical protein BSU04_26975 [Caballeronia sordidicola]|uniref:Uncharacterized protein n=1 Tax=Caballeronia sordidicola TaxID=196367 RepID=A0A226WWD7_CABSO|nr:hypothetical protein BSU04_26975 [Caballeronia sordidicola]